MFIHSFATENPIPEEQTEEFKKLAESAGLTEQIGLIDSIGDFPLQSDTLRRIVHAICPQGTIEPSKYRESILPIEIVTIIATAKLRATFAETFIMKNESNTCFALSGWKRPKNQSYGGTEYILAWWGELDWNMDKLRKLATEQLTERSERKFKEELEEAQSKLKNVKDLVIKHLNGDYVNGIN